MASYSIVRLGIAISESDSDIKLLEKIYEHLLQPLVKGHSKSSLEFLYLEAGALPIRFLISCRRMMYLHMILRRPDEELTKCVYRTQNENPTVGDFYSLVKNNWLMVGETLDEASIKASSSDVYKRKVKVQHLISCKRSKKNILKWKILNTKSYKPSNTNENLSCIIFTEKNDDQQHILRCKILQSKLESEDIVNGQVEYEDIFRHHRKHKVIFTMYKKLLEIRKNLLENSYNLHPSIVNSSSGNWMNKK